MIQQVETLERRILAQYPQPLRDVLSVGVELRLEPTKCRAQSFRRLDADHRTDLPGEQEHCDRQRNDGDEG